MVFVPDRKSVKMMQFSSTARDLHNDSCQAKTFQVSIYLEESLDEGDFS